ncbi:MAG TPA: HupE/UreJ family protein [Steroidobacteraceae bacterium]|nr:HupE/UreJ family protein [Steroidobacteraceae bacterium]
MSRWLHRVLWLLICVASPVHGHEVRPGYLEVTESGDAIRIVWRQPVAGAYGTPLVPKISTGWLDRAPQNSIHTDSFYEREWRIVPPHGALAGARIKVEGLERTITDVLVRIAYADGTELTQLLKPTAPSFTVPNPQKVAPPVREYLELGFTHIWSGIDHLLYVFGLMLLVGNTRKLIKTITGFTVAHSISLGAAALGYVHVPAAPVEAVIALSIVYVAVEILHARQRRTSLAQRAPWAVAFCFGLLHGLGFAGALSEVGLPAHAIPTALLLFNIGIEVGQLTFIAVLLLASRALLRWAPQLTRRLDWLPPYAIGSLASFWLLERIHAFL